MQTIKIIHVSAITFFAFLSFLTNSQVSFNTERIDANTIKVNFHFSVPANDFIYKEYLDVSIDSPQIILTDLHCSTEPIPAYAETFKETKKGYDKDFILSALAKRENEHMISAYVHISYYQHSNRKCLNQSFLIDFADQVTSNKIIETNIETNSSSILESHHEAVPIKSSIHSKQRENYWFNYYSRAMETLMLPIVQFLIFMVLSLIFLLFSKLLALIFVGTVIIFFLLNVLLPFYQTLFIAAIYCFILSMYLAFRVTFKKVKYRATLGLLSMLLLTSSIILYAKSYSEQYTYFS